jgi:hypothetical protein
MIEKKRHFNLLEGRLFAILLNAGMNDKNYITYSYIKDMLPQKRKKITEIQRALQTIHDTGMIAIKDLDISGFNIEVAPDCLPLIFSSCEQ